jgi:hypothetical protein
MQGISIHSIGRDGSHLKLKNLNEKRKLFNKFPDIKKTLIDIRDGCNLNEEGIVFIIGDYVGIEMNLKKIHKSVPTIIRTPFIKPTFRSITQLRKWFKYYLEIYSAAFQTIETHQEYQVAVRYPTNKQVQTVNQVAIPGYECSRCEDDIYSGIFGCSCPCHRIGMYSICHISFVKDEDCKGGFTFVAKKDTKDIEDIEEDIEEDIIYEKIFKMCRMEKNGSYNCYCDDN